MKTMWEGVGLFINMPLEQQILNASVGLERMDATQIKE